MADTMRRLARIEATAPFVYTATLANGHDQRRYKFTVSDGDIAAIEAPPEFSEDVGAFGYSHLVYKAVSAFHDAHLHEVGRPSDPATASPQQRGDAGLGRSRLIDRRPGDPADQ